jgi:ribonuclease III
MLPVFDEAKILREFNRRLKLGFTRLKLLKQALTHKSYANEKKLPYDNETLEYLGDSVLELVVNEYLFKTFPAFRESQLSRIKSFIVSKKNLFKIALDIGLRQALLLSRGEINTGGLDRESNLANAYEALLGALYLDRGLKPSEKFILRYLKPQIHLMVENKLDFDYKSQLQELVQKKHKIRPVYKLIEASGPDHAKIFTVEVWVNDRLYGKGTGRKKIVAEDSAARDALERMRSPERKDIPQN